MTTDKEKNRLRRRKWLENDGNRARDRASARERYHRKQKARKDAISRGELPLD